MGKDYKISGTNIASLCLMLSRLPTEEPIDSKKLYSALRDVSEWDAREGMGFLLVLDIGEMQKKLDGLAS